MPGLAIVIPPLVGLPSLGPFELIVVLAIVIIIFGVGRLPEIGGAVGKGIREFRKASKDDDEEPKKISEAQSTVQPPPAVPPVTPSAPPSMSVTCQKCGTANPPDNKHCSQCGASLGAPVG
jgi:sec-independent protein translocase protein TatA